MQISKDKTQIYWWYGVFIYIHIWPYTTAWDYIDHTNTSKRRNPIYISSTNMQCWLCLIQWQNIKKKDIKRFRRYLLNMFRSKQLHLQCINHFLHERYEYNQSHNTAGKIQRSPYFCGGCDHITNDLIITIIICAQTYFASFFSIQPAPSTCMFILISVCNFSRIEWLSLIDFVISLLKK